MSHSFEGTSTGAPMMERPSTSAPVGFAPDELPPDIWVIGLAVGIFFAVYRDAMNRPRQRAKLLRLMLLVISTILVASWLKSSPNDGLTIIEAIRSSSSAQRGHGFLSDGLQTWWAVDHMMAGPSLGSQSLLGDGSVLPLRTEQPPWQQVWTGAERVGASSQRKAPYTCGACVLDPLVYLDTFCSRMPTVRFNRTTVLPNWKELYALEPYTGVPKASMLDVIDALPGGLRTTIGVAGDSLMMQALDAMACDLRRIGLAHMAGFLDWDVVRATAGRLEGDARRMRRYRLAGPRGDGPLWFVHGSVAAYSREEVAKLLAVSDVVLIDVFLSSSWHERGLAGLHEIFQTLERHGAQPGKVAVVLETGTEHTS